MSRAAQRVILTGVRAFVDKVSRFRRPLIRQASSLGALSQQM